MNQIQDGEGPGDPGRWQPRGVGWGHLGVLRIVTAGNAPPPASLLGSRAGQDSPERQNQ